MLTKKNSVDWKEKCDFHTDVVYVDQKEKCHFHSVDWTENNSVDQGEIYYSHQNH